MNKCNLKALLKALLPYSGIIIPGLALLLFRIGQEDHFMLLRLEMIIVFGYIAAIFDLKSKRIPNGLLQVMFGTWVISMVPVIILDLDAAALLLADAFYGCAVSGGIFLVIYLLSRKEIGGGDVKFMALAGLYLGFTGALTSLLLGTVFAALTGLMLLLRKKIGRRDPMPLVPFLYTGILLTIFCR